MKMNKTSAPSWGPQRGIDSEPNKSRKVPAPGLPREPKYVEHFEQQQHLPLERRRLQQERKAEIMQTGRSFAPASRFPNHRPCIHPAWSNIIESDLVSAPNKAPKGMAPIRKHNLCVPSKRPVLPAASSREKPPTEREPKQSQNSSTLEPSKFHVLTAATFLEEPPKDSEPKQSLRYRDLLPLPVPDNEGIEFQGSRCVKRRLLRGSHASWHRA